jgi:hypothetical protein
MIALSSVPICPHTTVNQSIPINNIPAQVSTAENNSLSTGNMQTFYMDKEQDSFKRTNVHPVPHFRT